MRASDPFDVEVDPSIAKIRSRVKNGKCLKQALSDEKKESASGEKTSDSGNKPPVMAETKTEETVFLQMAYETSEAWLDGIGPLEQLNTAYAPKRKYNTFEANWLNNIGPIEQTNTSYAPQKHCVEPSVAELLAKRKLARENRVAKKDGWVILDKPTVEVQCPAPIVPATPAPAGILAVKAVKSTNIIRRRPAWYHRIIPGFKKHASEFDFDKPINHRIGMLESSKSAKADQQGVIVPDDIIIESLYYELRLKQNAEYPDRKLKLEHTLKLAQKWIETEKSERQSRGETLKTDTPTFVNSFQATVQKAVDQSDSKFLYQEENQQISRWKGFLPARLVGTPLVKRNC